MKMKRKSQPGDVTAFLLLLPFFLLPPFFLLLPFFPLLPYYPPNTILLLPHGYCNIHSTHGVPGLESRESRVGIWEKSSPGGEPFPPWKPQHYPCRGPGGVIG